MVPTAMEPAVLPHGLPEDDAFARWCRQLVASDREAFNALFAATSQRLYRYALRLTQQADRAEDIVQDVFLRLWLKRATLDPGRSLRALLYVMVRNQALTHERTAVKRKALLSAMDEPDVGPTPEETTRARLLGAHLRRWINELPDRRREAFQLSRFDGLSYEEIAGVMGLSVKTVDNHIWKALQHLRRRLHAFDADLLQP